MGTAQTLLLGAIAGITIFIGLPIARVRGLRMGAKAGMSALSTGILVFLLWDVLSHGVAPVETSLNAHDWGTFTLRTTLALVGFGVGYMSLVYYDWWLKCRRASPMVGTGATAADEGAAPAPHHMSPARRLSLLIATGIGIHNFGEGLAIGQSAAAGEVALAVVLIIGFGLHNMTEGFGVVGPLAADPELPSWRFLGLLGLIGGAPTFIGTAIGHVWVSVSLEIVFFALAGGSILYVVGELLAVCRRYSMPIVVGWTLMLGVVIGFATDFILTAAGG
ncbi:MAG: zinc permease [Actinomycetes bacterium]